MARAAAKMTRTDLVPAEETSIFIFVQFSAILAGAGTAWHCRVDAAMMNLIGHRELRPPFGF
jgi:hypothetical protein